MFSNRFPDKPKSRNTQRMVSGLRSTALGLLAERGSAHPFSTGLLNRAANL